MEKNLNLFFAEELRKRTLTEDQSMTLMEVLFPPKESTPRAAMKANLEAEIAFRKWNKQYHAEEAQRPKPQEKPKVINQEQLDDLIRLEVGE